jgi:hypothetical protein
MSRIVPPTAIAGRIARPWFCATTGLAVAISCRSASNEMCVENELIYPLIALLSVGSAFYTVLAVHQNGALPALEVPEP